MTATILPGLSYDHGVFAVLVAGRGYWVRDHVTHYAVAPDDGGEPVTVWARAGRATACSRCGRRACVHKLAVEAVLETW